jgi:hypothetical protein
MGWLFFLLNDRTLSSSCGGLVNLDASHTIRLPTEKDVRELEELRTYSEVRSEQCPHWQV